MSSGRNQLRTFGLLLSLCVVLGLAACAGSSDDEPAATPAGAVETQASATEAASATIEPEATETPVPPTTTATEVPATPVPVTATTMPVISNAELVALAETIHPEVTSGFYAACDTLANAPCPLTTRLRLRVASPDIRLCRCQNGSDSREVEPLPDRLENGGGIVRVTMYQGNTAYDLVVVSEGGEWRLDDQYCAGRPETSIYEDAGPC